MRKFWKFSAYFFGVFVGCLLLQAADKTAGDVVVKTQDVLISKSCTLDLISSLIQDGPPSNSDKIIGALNQKIHVTLENKDIGDTTKTWMAEDYGLTNDDYRKYYPLRVRLTIAKKNLPFDPSSGGRRVIYLLLWAWAATCPDSFGETAALLRTKYVPNIFPDLPGAVTATYSSGKLSTRFTITPLGSNSDKIMSVTVETWESE